MRYKYPDAVLMIFCKAPVPGQVKTRLLPELSAAEAAAIHVELSHITLQLAVQSRLCAVQLWCTPTIEHPFFTAASLTYGIPLYQQQGSDLGAKMHNAFGSSLNRYSGALIIGTDCPSLTIFDMDQALSSLLTPNSCVLGPAEDGGYVLIGLNQPHRELFSGISWGTKLVFEQTRAQIDFLNLHYFELQQQWDIDNPEDLIRYRTFKHN